MYPQASDISLSPAIHRLGTPSSPSMSGWSRHRGAAAAARRWFFAMAMVVPMALVAVEVGSSVCFLGFLKNIFYFIHMKFFITFSWRQHDKKYNNISTYLDIFCSDWTILPEEIFFPRRRGGGVERFFRSNWTFSYLTTHNIFTLNRDLQIVRKYLWIMRINKMGNICCAK